MRENMGYWFNYDTNDFEFTGPPETEEQAIKMIPNIAAARMLYKLYREIGDPILEAMRKVLEACVGEKEAGDAE